MSDDVARRGYACAAQDAKEIRFADIKSVLPEEGTNIGQGGSLRRSSQARSQIASRFGDALGPGVVAVKSELTSGSRAKSRTMARTEQE